MASEEQRSFTNSMIPSFEGTFHSHQSMFAQNGQCFGPPITNNINHHYNIQFNNVENITHNYIIHLNGNQLDGIDKKFQQPTGQ